MKYTYRILAASEWDKLKPLVESKYLPSPDTASCAVAEDEQGNITGVLFLQLALHMEPLVLNSPSVSFERLHNTLLDAVQQDKGLHIYVFSNSNLIDRMADHVGMKQLPYIVYEQVVT